MESYKSLEWELKLKKDLVEQLETTAKNYKQENNSLGDRIGQLEKDLLLQKVVIQCRQNRTWFYMSCDIRDYVTCYEALAKHHFIFRRA